MTNIAVAGTSRVGKTTVAREVADLMDKTFIATSASAVFKAKRINATWTLPFKERIALQSVILDAFEAQWSKAIEPFITDRSPLDCLAYTMYDVRPNELDDDDREALELYTERCFNLTNEMFSFLMLVQPGITVTEEKEGWDKKPDSAVQEVMNTIIGGLIQDERCTVTGFAIPRKMLSIDKRVKSVEFAYRMFMTRLDPSVPDRDQDPSFH